MSRRAAAAAAAAVIIFIVISVIAVNSTVVVTHSRSANKRRYNKIRVMYTRTFRRGRKEVRIKEGRQSIEGERDRQTDTESCKNVFILFVTTPSSNLYSRERERERDLEWMGLDSSYVL